MPLKWRAAIHVSFTTYEQKMNANMADESLQAGYKELVSFCYVVIFIQYFLCLLDFN